MHRFFTSEKNISKNKITLYGEDVDHIRKVLRCRAGDAVVISDGRDYEYNCTISSIDKKEVICEINEKRPNVTEAEIKIHLYQGIPKAAKMDLIIQKCTELGVHSITPVNMDRAVVKFDNKENDNKLTRWRRIAEEAAKQSCRGRIPHIFEPMDFDDVLNDIKDYDMAIMPYEREDKLGLKHILNDEKACKDIAVIIGPEGGFSDKEVIKANEAGIVTVTLGPRILRTETAGFTCLAILMYELGDMGGE
ncbi:ribosomal RNA small subunit methyltransferase E [Oxobacter pfennigii]|uniref:Ribosomal RNA small subunit methyltransferase E n=1 Tax=Oxobacter pfennigii TaxID=36849 RepID=A0A0P8WNK3_9CLOT|nr:16S rRNA (uracil(1498)-N(3))-methyltransferase [Oxobacter pfennigii]KPU44122.1 ribosomal RNA small subunit methyltransferase E [Oxobacter pfennigii]